MAGTLVITTLSDGTNSTSATNCIQGSSKSWVNFNGTGTVAIRASYNVSSITDNGTGNYTINFTNALADANYSATASASFQTTGSADPVGYSSVRTYATSSVVILTASGAGALLDYPIINVAIFD